jgi:hypothetical protein
MKDIFLGALPIYFFPSFAAFNAFPKANLLILCKKIDLDTSCHDKIKNSILPSR